MSIFKKLKSLLTPTPKEQPKSWGEYVKEVTCEDAPAPAKEVAAVAPPTPAFDKPTAPEVIESSTAPTPEMVTAVEPEFVAAPPTPIPAENIPDRPFADQLNVLVPEPFEYTSQDFIKFGYRSSTEVVEFSSRPASGWTWFSEYTKPEQTRPVKSWREENKLAAEMLLEKHGDALAIFYDGSFAAQITLLSFSDAGKIPRVYAVTFSDEEQKPNALTSHYANLSFPLRVIEMRAEDFWKTRGVEMITWFNAISSSEAMKMWARTAAGGVPLFCSGLPYVEKFGDEWRMADHEQYFLLDTAVRSAKTEVIPAFFRYTPEQILSFLGQATEALEEMNETDSYTNSFELLKKWYPELIEDNQELSPLAKLHELKARQLLIGFISICWHKVKNV